MKTRKPKTQKPPTPSEILQFQGGIRQDLSSMEYILDVFRQSTVRATYAMANYEAVLRKIAKGKNSSAKLASDVLKKHRF